MTALALFISTFCLVFCLGLQSLFVNGGHRAAAFGNSVCIGLGNLVLFKLAPDANGLEIAAYLCGGPFGIVTSMIVFARLRRAAWWPVQGVSVGRKSEAPSATATTATQHGSNVMKGESA